MFDKVKPFIVRAKVFVQTSVQNFAEAKEILKGARANGLRASDGLVVQLSRSGIDKAFSGKAVEKSTDTRAHALIAANLPQVFSKAVLGWSKEDEKGDMNITQIFRYFSSVEVDGRGFAVKFTIKEHKQETEEGQKNTFYSLETVEITSLDSAIRWLDAGAKKDGYENAAAAQTATAAGAVGFTVKPHWPATEPCDNNSTERVTPLEMVEALSQITSRGFSQGFKGDFFPEQRLLARWKNADRSTLLHESGHAFFSMEMGAAAELAKIDER